MTTTNRQFSFTDEDIAFLNANDNAAVSASIVGKNFSCANTAQRRKSDFYETPYSMTQQFLDLGLFNRSQTVLEPASGDGAIVKILKQGGFGDVAHYDQEKDFLKEAGSYPQILTNPPFSLAYEFIQTAKRVAEHRFAMLLPLSYLHGKQRLDGIYSDRAYALKSVHVFVRYPMLGDRLRDDGKYRTGMMVYAWYLWERGYSGDPTIGWIDNQPFILSVAKRPGVGKDGVPS